jgi:chromosome segregation ATPase
MDEGTREGSQTVGPSAPAQEDRSPEQIQEEIAQTREQLGDTVEALASKADVKGQAKARASELKETAQQKKEEFTAKLKDVTPEGTAARAQQLATKARKDPLPFAVGGAFLIGFIFGRSSSR